MKNIIILTLLSCCFIARTSFAQLLSHLNATSNDALYTTYAAPPERTSYVADQGYQFRFNDNENGIEMYSENGPNSGIAFHLNDRLHFKLNEMYRAPVITVSYSDLICYYYYPCRDLKVEVTFVVYSSQWAVFRYRISNSGYSALNVGLIPYLYYPSKDSTMDIGHENLFDAYSFPLRKPRDNWMLEHHIPLTESLNGYFASNLRFDSTLLFTMNGSDHLRSGKMEFITPLKQSFCIVKHGSQVIKGIAGFRTLSLAPGEATSFSMTIGLSDARNRKSEELKKISFLFNLDFNSVIKTDEKAYSKIPLLKFADKDRELLYWSSFSLMRQCMMPPEGECHYNYYVFSREPSWGWGFGGQVFHESLSMLAYAYMDPAGAMNSQRVFMERQHKDGYINYRTGPYLNETIPTNGKLTSSAPWFNYENLEVFRISGDRKFLSEAYESGKKFYRYFVASHDSNDNGLCGWGAHAELESVRDARVAVWDKVGWAGNFEGPDLNSMLVKEARSLAEMARILGKNSDAGHWTKDAEKRAALINTKLWDKETKFYYNVNKTRQTFTFHSSGDLKIKEIIGFLPLWAGVSDATKAGFLVRKMKDPEEFWRPNGIPSLSAKSDYYCPIGYWNGPVWVQWNYLLFRGLLDYGYRQDASALADRVLNAMIYHLKKDHVFWEFYSPDENEAGWNKTYIWAGIAARFLIDSDSARNGANAGHKN